MKVAGWILRWLPNRFANTPTRPRCGATIRAGPRLMRRTPDSSHPRGPIESDSMMSIIPDAHSIRELDRLHCGVEMARKGGVADCILMRCRGRLSFNVSNAGAVPSRGPPNGTPPVTSGCYKSAPASHGASNETRRFRC